MPQGASRFMLRNAKCLVWEGRVLAPVQSISLTDFDQFRCTSVAMPLAKDSSLRLFVAFYLCFSYHL